MRWLAPRLFLEDGGPEDRLAATRAAVAVGAMLLCLSLAIAFSTPSLYGNDERAHLGYVAVLLRGDLPTVDTPIPVEPGLEVLGASYPDRPGGDDRDDVWVANHPPLAHAVAAPLVWLGGELGPAWAAPMALRVVSSALMALGVLAGVAVADALAPGRPSRSVLVAAVVGLTPMVVSVAALGQTDGAGFVVGTALLAVTLRLVRAGATPQRLGCLVALAVVAALTRVSLLPLIGLAALAWLVTERRRPSVAVLGAVLVALTPAVTAGWFYARNLDLYGDIAGASYLQDKFDRVAGARTVELLVRPQLWAGVWQDMWGSFDFGRIGTGGVRVGSSRPDLGTRLVLGGLVAAVAILGALRRLAQGVPHVRRADLAVWTIALAWLGVCVVGLASFASGGGTPHPRYLLPAHAVTGALLVAGITAILPLRRAWPTALVGLLGINLLLLLLLRDAVANRATPDVLLLPDWTVAVVVIAGLGAVASALTALHHATSIIEPPTRAVVPA
jgi:hypothetical protein